MPKLRFPEFQKSEEWVVKPMHKLYAFKGNNSFSREKLNYENGSVKNIHYGDIHTKFSTHFDITREDVPYINEFALASILKNESFCVAGDLIFADASEDLEDIGKAIEIIRLDGERVVSGLHTILARQIERDLVLGFSGHLFKSKLVRTQIQKESQGTKVLGLSGGRLAKIKLAFPQCSTEQQKITDCLSSLDELIAAQARKVDALKTHKKGLMQQLFPREGETQPRLRFPEFRDAAEWENGSLGGIFETTSGGTPSRTDASYWNGDIPWITTSLVNFGVINGAEEFITKDGLNNSSAKLLPKGAVLIAMYGQGKTRGKVALLGVDATTNQECAAIRPKQGINPYFVFLNLAGRYDEFRSLSNSGGQENLSQGLIRDFPFAYPLDEDEQKRIADCLRSLDVLIAATAQALESLKTHKKGLMQQLFPSAEAVEA